MRPLLLACLLIAGCLGPADPPPADPAPEPAAPADPDPPAPVEEPAASASTPAARNDTQTRTVEGEVTLLLHPVLLPTDVLGVRIALAEAASVRYELAWNATLATQAELALRIHERGVLDDEGRVVLTGGAPLVTEARGASPLVLQLDLPAGEYDAHVYTADQTSPVVRQPFVLVASWPT